MKKNKQWIMDKQTIEKFNKYRMQKYRAAGFKGQIQDSKLTKYYVKLIISFFSKKKENDRQKLFLYQKLTHMAVCLFKRFYLVNQFSQYNDPDQNAACCVYLSQKLNQFPHQNIIKGAQHEKKQGSYFGKYINYGTLGYKDKQLRVLRGIGFQIGKSPLINSIQSLMTILQTKTTQQTKYQGYFKQIINTLTKVYIDENAIFLFEGPKLGLAVVLHVIKTMNVQEDLGLTLQQIYGVQLVNLIKKNEKQLTQIIQYISKLQLYSQQKADVQKLYDRIIKKNNYQKPQVRSPRPMSMSMSMSGQFKDIKDL